MEHEKYRVVVVDNATNQIVHWAGPFDSKIAAEKAELGVQLERVPDYERFSTKVEPLNKAQVEA